MKLRTPALLFFTLWSLSSTAQSQTVLQGIVINEQQEPVPFAGILLHNAADSTLLSSELADSNGHFSLKPPDPGRPYLLETTSLGYHAVWTLLPSAANDTQSHTITLPTSGELLQDVTIRSAKALIERQADRTVFNVDQSIAAIGSDAYDILKKAPGVKVSNGEVGIVGKSTVSVMINDRLVQVTGAELESMLRSMPAASITKIEVITAPPARYDAEGNSGIINIVTRKPARNGLNGNITLNYEQHTKGSQSLQSAFNYRQGKLNVYGNFNASRLRYISRQQTNTFYTEQQQEQVLDQDNRPVYTWLQLGADFNLSPRSVIGILYTRGTMDTRRDERINTRALRMPAGTADSVMYTNAFATDKGIRNVFNLNYEWKIDSAGRKLVLNTDYFTREGNKTRDFTTANFRGDGIATGNNSDNRTAGDQLTDIATTRADLDWPLSFALLSGGLKATFIHNNSDNRFTYLSGQEYRTDPGKTNTFDYRENTQAAYINARRSWGKWEAQLGLRAEYTQTKGASATLSQTNTNNYFKLFPSAYLQYSAKEDHSWNINYTRRINRPSFWDMNPFRVYSTATAYEEGNPFLQPSFGNNIEIGYSYKSMLAVTLFAQQVQNLATRVSRIDTVNNAFYFNQANAGNEMHYGFTATLSFSPLPWWENTTQLYGSYNRFSSSYYNTPVQYGSPALSVETDNTFILNEARTILAELGFSYATAAQSDFDIQRHTADLRAGFKVLLCREQLVLALNATDILKTDIWQMENQYNGTFQRSYFDERSIGMSLTWKFGNKSIKGRRERNTTLEDAGRAN